MKQKANLNLIEECENKDFCKVAMPFEDNKVLKFNQNQKSDKVLFVIYIDLECLTEKFD